GATAAPPLGHPSPPPSPVAMALGVVEMAIAEPQRRLDGVDAHLLLQGHGAEPDCRNAGAVCFNHSHYKSLPAQQLSRRTAPCTALASWNCTRGKLIAPRA